MKFWKLVCVLVLCFLMLSAGLLDIVNGNHGWEAGSPEADFSQNTRGELILVTPVMPYVGCTEAEEKYIWDFLLDFIGNAYGAAGVMGNFCVESGLRSTNLQNSYEKSLGYTDVNYTQAVDDGSYHRFAVDSAGYGLAQWTFSGRKAALYNFAQREGTSIGNLEMQLNFAKQELSGSAVFAVISSAHSVREASDEVLLKYERPADQSIEAQIRRANVSQYFYNKFQLGLGTESGLTQKQKDVIRIAMNSASYGVPAEGGYCQRWAALVYRAAGLPTDGSCCAYHSGVRYGVSDDWSVIPPGAAVYGYSNQKYGHVGIYVGGGLVYHNVGGVAVDTLTDWIRKYKGFCWGWEAGSDLTQMD